MSEYRDDKFHMLHEGYLEPYHYYFSLDPFALHKELYWGLEYYSYVSRIHDLLMEEKFSTLLDVGCGDGFIINTLARRKDGFALMKGIDLSERAIAHANAHRNSDKVVFDTLDVRELRDSFDIILLIEVLEHIPSELIKEFTSALIDRLAPGGLLVVSVPTTNIELIESHHRHYSLDLLTRHLGQRVNLLDHHFIFDRDSAALKLVRRLMINRYYILRNRGMLDFLLKKAKKSFPASPDTGAHLLGIFQR